MKYRSLHKKWSFPLRTSSVNVTKSPGNSGFGHIYWRNTYRKTSFFCAVIPKSQQKKNNIPKKVTLWTYEYHERTLSEAHLLTTTYIVSHHKQTIVSKNARISELYIHCSPGCASITNSFWRICCKGTNINAVTLTETWLQYYKYQQNYFQIQHYFKTEEAK